MDKRASLRERRRGRRRSGEGKVDLHKLVPCG